MNAPKTLTISALTLLLVLSSASAARAADDGETQPKLTTATLSSPNTSTDIIGTTNGSGNVKGIHCLFAAQVGVTINIYVNGGSAQAIYVDPYNCPEDNATNKDSGWIPMNVRFSSSIRVQMQRSSSPVIYGNTICQVSWALD
jgi:hypothetical protein